MRGGEGRGEQIWGDQSIDKKTTFLKRASSSNWLKFFATPMRRTSNSASERQKLPSSFRHGAPRAVHIARLHASTRSRGANLEPRAAQGTTLHINRSIVFRGLSFTQGPIDALVGSTSVGKWGSGSNRGTRGATPNRFGRCTLRQHRVLLLPCVLQLSPSAYHSRDNCRRHEGAPLVGTRINYLGEQIDPRITVS
jgi:hypothetical protein